MKQNKKIIFTIKQKQSLQIWPEQFLFFEVRTLLCSEFLLSKIYRKTCGNFQFCTYSIIVTVK